MMEPSIDRGPQGIGRLMAMVDKIVEEMALQQSYRAKKTRNGIWEAVHHNLQPRTILKDNQCKQDHKTNSIDWSCTWQIKLE
jgi:hypothetical protein